MARSVFLRARRVRRRLRIARRIFDRQVRTATRLDVEYSDLRVRGLRRGLCDFARDVIDLAMREIHRRVRRVRSRGRVAGRAVPGAEAARGGAWLHASVLFLRRRDGQWHGVSDLEDGHLAARDLWRTRELAVLDDLRPDSRDPTDHYPAAPSRIAGLAGEEGRRHVETPEHRRTVQPRIPKDDADYCGDVRM